MTEIKNKYDCIVVGAGSMGMAAGYYLAKRGVQTLLIDAGDPPHEQGSHHGETRILRHAYGEGREYVPFSLHSHQLWRELEAEAGQPLFANTGLLCVGKPDYSFTGEMIASAKQFSLPLEVLEREEIEKRWPGFRIPQGYIGCFEPEAGVLFSQECIKAYRHAAVRYGAHLLPNTKIEHLLIDAAGAKVKIGSETLSCDQLIVSAGAWTKKVLSSTGLHLPLQPTRKTVAWFDSDEDLYNPGVFPAFFFDLPNESYYGFPSFNQSGVKIGKHDGGRKVDPDHFRRQFGAYLEDEQQLARFLQSFMPQAAGNLNQGKVCLYNMTPDEHFVVDRHPQHKHVLIATGFSGHGFKFASGVGEHLSQMIIDEKKKIDLSMFSITRFSEVLQQ